MLLFTWANEAIKSFNWFDTKLIAWGGICIGILLVRWIPWLPKISVWWIIGIGALCLLRVYYVLLFK